MRCLRQKNTLRSIFSVDSTSTEVGVPFLKAVAITAIRYRVIACNIRGTHGSNLVRGILPLAGITVVGAARIVADICHDITRDGILVATIFRGTERVAISALRVDVTIGPIRVNVVKVDVGAIDAVWP